MKPLVYVAGPYTRPDPAQNSARAIRIATQLLDSGTCLPYCPHLSILWDMLTPRPYEAWLGLDLDVIDHCQALLRIPGESSGADREVDHAKRRQIPVFLHVAEVLDWASRWQS
jgi:hypothetical protein